jgi:ribosomal protein L15
MKAKISRLCYLTLSLIIIFALLYSVNFVYANTDGEYVIKNSASGYELISYVGADTAASYFLSLDECLASLSGGRIYFQDVVLSQSVSIKKGNFTFCGTVTFCDYTTLEIDGAKLKFESLSLSSAGGKIRIKSGSLTVINSEISSSGKTLFTLDHSSNANLEIIGGKFTSPKDTYLIENTRSSVKISGGDIEGDIKNSASLILSGAPLLHGKIYTECPIWLSDGENEFSQSAKIYTNKSFENGKIELLFYCASENSLSSVKVYDVNLKPYTPKHFDEFRDIDEKNFGAVYLPLYVDFYADGELFMKKDALLFESVSMPNAPEKQGYGFLGWFDKSGEIFDFNSEICESQSLYAKYSLSAPSFSLSSLSFTYDKCERSLEISELSHPLLSEGEISYLWYKDGNAFSTLEKIPIKSVSDSGSYACNISFAYGTDFVSIMTPSVSVSVKKATVEISAIAKQEYTGNLLFPLEESTEIYSVFSSGGIDVGKYAVKITLLDPNNYAFSDCVGKEKTLEFEILKAENSFLSSLKIESFYVGNSPSPSASAKFGDLKYLYSTERDGEYSSEIPKAAGTYFVRAAVSESKNYTGLYSEPCEFSIYPEKVVGVIIESEPIKKSYVAFEKLSKDGLSLTAIYDSGRKAPVPNDDVSVLYNDGKSLKYGDLGVRVGYMGVYTILALEVGKAEYEFLNFSFSSQSLEYNGKRQSLTYLGALPVGLDGVSPSVSIIGGGTNVGTYTVILEFSTESENYKIPERIVANLTVTPREVYAQISDTEFIYDGKSKIPSAYYLDVFGREVMLEILGAKSLAGKYSAVIVSNDPNYKIKNSEIDFEIKKANYDMSSLVFSDTEFIYDGTRKTVKILSGLPEGVSVIGYTDNSGINAGKYFTKFTFSYDTKNYNPPSIDGCEWEIKKGKYAHIDGLFSDNEAIYDGLMHYPNVLGKMPVGADGISLEYSFSGGAVNVLDGKCQVTVSFHSESENYELPCEIKRYVWIIPKKIEIFWQEEAFVYNGNKQAPTAKSDECELSVLGAVSDAGSYTARAIPLDRNFEIINSEYSFTIKKAENFWQKLPEIENVYYGREPNPSALAAAGTTVYRFFKDEALLYEIEKITEVGVYYLQAYSDGDKNHNPIFSDALRFEIMEILPTGISVTLSNNIFSAFEKIDSSLFSVSLMNNDGTSVKINSSEITVSYPSASESLRFGDSFVTFSYGGFSKEAAVKVERAHYDMSGISWADTRWVYDGKMHLPTLVGLPDGVSVTEYIGELGVDAGKYKISASLSYDEQNYNKPEAPYVYLVIEKKKISPPKIEKLIYNGNLQSPKIEESELYSIRFGENKDVGTYPVYLKINDTKNYSFDGLSEITLYYEIEPKEIEIKIFDVHTYIFERAFEFSYEITGDGLEKWDELEIEFSIENGKIFAKSKNPSYRLVYAPALFTEHNSFSKDGGKALFISVLVLILLVLLSLVIYFSRYRLARAYASLKYKDAPIAAVKNKAKELPALTEPEKDEEKEMTAKEESEEIKIPMNREQADELISDNLAKSLVKKEDLTVYTNGSRRSIINVDTLSDNFKNGDKVDVNDLKTKSLVPYDTGYIKVLARGVIDKSLNVYANDFSLSAIKMIALTGGKATRVYTKAQKSEKKNQ